MNSGLYWSKQEINLYARYVSSFLVAAVRGHSEIPLPPETLARGLAHDVPKTRVLVIDASAGALLGVGNR